MTSTDKICRLCLFQGDEAKLKYIWDHELNDVTHKILECVSIQITSHDGLPQYVCLYCLGSLNTWESFKNQCFKSLDFLSKNFKDTTGNVSLLNHSTQDEKDAGVYKVQNGFEEDPYFQNQSALSSKGEENTTNMGFPSNENSLKKGKDNETTSKVIIDRKVNQESKDSTKIVCEQCGKNFTSKPSLKCHTQTAHSGIKSYICKICDKTFALKRYLIIHTQTHSEERKYSCKLCNYSSKTAIALHLHKAKHSNNINECDTCSKTYKSKLHLSQHIKRVHAAAKTHNCSHCSSKFRAKYLLERHLKIHLNIRPYICKVCPKSFHRIDGLNDHMVTHGSKEIMCSECGKDFYTKKSLQRHNCASKFIDN